MPHSTQMVHALREFLTACGLDLSHPDFSETPQRVSTLWMNEFLAGYEMDPQTILADPVVGEPDPEIIVIRDLAFHSMCPHHLLPYRGRAYVAYQPNGRLVGFGRIAKLVECFTKRLTLQERATHQIAQALLEHLPADGAACILHAEQLCLALPGARHEETNVVTTAFLGSLKGRHDLHAQLIG